MLKKFYFAALSGLSTIFRITRRHANNFYYKLPTINLATQSTQYVVTQSIEGFKSVLTFPFTLGRILFYKNSKAFAYHTLQYNILYYAAPVFLYWGYIQPHLNSALLHCTGSTTYIIDGFIFLIFLRALINTYLHNIFNNINASTIALEPSNHFELLPKCDCPLSLHLKANLLGPVNYLAKIFVCTILEAVPYLGRFITYTLKPLAIGESLLEVKLFNLCLDHKNDFVARHTFYVYATGMACLFSAYLVNTFFSQFFGIESFFLSDAIYNFLFPLIIFHIHNHPLSPLLESGHKFDIFYSLRQSVLDGITFFKDNIKNRFAFQSRENFVERFKTLWNKPMVYYPRKLIFYPKIQYDLNSFLNTGPIRLFLQEKEKAYIALFKYLNSVGEYPLTARFSANAYYYIPYVPFKTYISYIVSVLTDDPEHTKQMLSLVEHTLKNATATWELAKITVHDDISLIDNYLDAENNLESWFHPLFNAFRITKHSEPKIVENYIEPILQSSKKVETNSDEKSEMTSHILPLTIFENYLPPLPQTDSNPNHSTDTFISLINNENVPLLMNYQRSRENPPYRNTHTESRFLGSQKKTN